MIHYTNLATDIKELPLPPENPVDQGIVVPAEGGKS